MNSSRGLALYKRLRRLYPLSWRNRYEQEFIETLLASENEGSISKSALLVDLCQLALLLRYRQLRDTLLLHFNRFPAWRLVSPVAGVVWLAALLIYCTFQWGGQLSLEFIVTSTLIVLVPGVGVLYTISNAIAGGRNRGIIAATGCTLGIVPHLIVAFLGLSGIMQLGATVFEVVRWVGVAYLAWMGISMLRQQGIFQLINDEQSHSASSGTSTLSVIGRGILFNLLNPKLTLFFFAFLPQFLSNKATDTTGPTLDFQLIGLSSLFMLLTLAGFVLYALVGAAIRSWSRRSPSALNFMQRTFGVILIGFATRLAISDR